MTWTGLSAPTGPRWPGGRAYLREIRRSAELLRERSLVPAARTMDGSPPPPPPAGGGGSRARGGTARGTFFGSGGGEEGRLPPSPLGGGRGGSWSRPAPFFGRT